MKRNLIFILTALAVVSIGCTKELETEVSNGSSTYVTRTYTAGIGNATKTSADAEGKVSWNAGDVVRYYSVDNGAVDECSLSSEAVKAELTLNVASDASSLVAVYGGTSLSDNTSSGVTVTGAVPSEQSGTFGDAHIAAVKTTDLTQKSLTFQNIVSYLKFTLTRTDVAKIILSSNDDTALTGNGEVKLTFSGDDITASFGDSKSSSVTVNNGGAGTFYIATLPCTMSAGFTVDCFDADGHYLGSAVSSKSTTVKSGTILNLGTIDTNIERIYTDLSAAGTANCYIAPKVGCYKFNATVKGSSSELIGGTPTKAEVLWESFGTDETPSVGDIVFDASYSDGYVSFTSGKNGNAVIAIEDASDNILWSWHIWVCEGYDPATSDQVYANNAGTMMDRNLGATSATPGDVHALGLLYQWGRKDPFLGSSSISEQADVASTITWPSAVTSDAITGTIAYVTDNPTTYIKGNSSNSDWYYTGNSSTDDTRWQTSDNAKGVYDPCPAGYRVPDGGDSSIWSNADFKSKYKWDSSNFGVIYNSTVWYPAAGKILDNSLFMIGSSICLGCYWSCLPDYSFDFVYFFMYHILMYSSDYVDSNIADAESVRCQKE